MSEKINNQPQQKCAFTQGYSQRARDLLPAQCHSELDNALRYSDCSARDVYNACRTKAISCKNGRLVQRGKFLDLTLGGILLTLSFGLYCYGMFLVAKLWETAVAWPGTLAIWGPIIIATVLANIATGRFLTPHKTASKIIKFLEENR